MTGTGIPSTACRTSSLLAIEQNQGSVSGQLAYPSTCLRQTQQGREIGCTVSSHWIPPLRCVPTRPTDKGRRQARVDVSSGAASGSTIDNVRQALVPVLVDERVQEPERFPSLRQTVAIQQRHDRCKSGGRSTAAVLVI